MDGNVYTFKACLVAKGFTQTYGVDYGETFSLVADIRAIRILLAIVTFYDYEIWANRCQDSLSKQSSKRGRIYGATRRNKRFDKEIKKIGFAQNPDEPCVYLKARESNVAFLVLYVDDILLMGNSVAMLFHKSMRLDALDLMLPFAQNLCSRILENPDEIHCPSKPTVMSSTEAEYIAIAEASMEAVWMRKFIDGLGGVIPSNKRPMEMLRDNEPALAITGDLGILK
ncbi:retrotransposon protein, putative, ty1-copia subclass [Tanacetum coccineum]